MTIRMRTHQNMNREHGHPASRALIYHIREAARSNAPWNAFTGNGASVQVFVTVCHGGTSCKNKSSSSLSTPQPKRPKPNTWLNVCEDIQLKVMCSYSFGMVCHNNWREAVQTIQVMLETFCGQRTYYPDPNW